LSRCRNSLFCPRKARFVENVKALLSVLRRFTSRQMHAYELIDRIPSARLSAVVCLLENMLDPVSLANAPVEEEEITSKRPRRWTAPHFARSR
jgi:hypothetical protein